MNWEREGLKKFGRFWKTSLMVIAGLAGLAGAIGGYLWPGLIADFMKMVLMTTDYIFSPDRVITMSAVTSVVTSVLAFFVGYKNKQSRHQLDDAIRKLQLVSDSEKAEPAKGKTSSVAGIMIQHRLKDMPKPIFALVSILFALSLLDLEYYCFIRNTVLIFLFIYVSNFLIFVLRVRLGFYGNTASEVREILRFINENSDKDTFGDGKGRRIKLFPEEQKETAEAPSGVPATIGGGK